MLDNVWTNVWQCLHKCWTISGQNLDRILNNVWTNVGQCLDKCCTISGQMLVTNCQETSWFVLLNLGSFIDKEYIWQDLYKFWCTNHTCDHIMYYTTVYCLVQVVQYMAAATRAKKFKFAGSNKAMKHFGLGILVRFTPLYPTWHYYFSHMYISHFYLFTLPAGTLPGYDIWDSSCAVTSRSVRYTHGQI